MPGDGADLPPWLDQPGRAAGDLSLSAWFLRATLGEALPPGARARLAPLADAPGGEAALPVLQLGGRRLRSLTTPYSLGWGALAAPGATPEAIRAGAAALGRSLLRLRPPALLEAVLEEDPPTAAALAGLRDAGLRLLPYAHFANWREALPEGAGWPEYLAGRDPALRTTIARKLSRAAREGSRFAWLTEPGPALEEGIAAFEAVRAASWKPEEPFPRFDAALMRLAAEAGALRLAVLHGADGGPLAAQYWLLDTHQGRRRATIPKLFHAEAARALSPGTALTAWALRRLIEEDAVREVDFGRGDDPYKRLWARERGERRGMVVASPWHPLGLAEIARAAARRLVLGAAARRLVRGGAHSALA